MDERIGFGLHQSCGDRGSVGHVSVFWLQWCGVGGVGGEWVGGLDQCRCYVCMRCSLDLWVDGRFRYRCMVLGGYLHI